MFTKQINSFICINCNHKIKNLHKSYSNTVKTVNCEKCHKVADKYIEFEPIIIILDSLLLSELAYRHILYNREFKLFWKLFIILWLVESFTLWREKVKEPFPNATHAGTADFKRTSENGFYICCLENIFDYFLCTALLLLATVALKTQMILQIGFRKFFYTLLKANALANFSKFLLLPILIWRENTTNSNLHHILVMGHHLFSLIYVYKVVSRYRIIPAVILVLFIFITKEFVMRYFKQYIEINLY